MSQKSSLMSKEDLEKYIIELLKSQNLCVLATSKSEIPRATPLEYYSKDTTVYIMLENGKTIENIRSNPIVSIGIFASYKSWLSLKGLQIMGKARILKAEDPEYEELLKSYVKLKEERERELREMLPNWKSMELIQIKAESIELFDTSLAVKDFAMKQTWLY